MCGIVGLFLKQPKLEPELGALLSQMLDIMCDRGPDSAGFAVYGAGSPGFVKLTLRGPAGTDFAALGAAIGHPVTARDTHGVLSVPAAEEAAVRAALARLAPEVRVVGAGARMELYKEVGLPADVARRFHLEAMSGTHAIGHTRMATESAVTTDGAHPFSTGPDQCLVHNGSLSNHAGVRRLLAREGLEVTSENDSEVAAAYLTYRMRGGDTLGQALEHSLGDLDGFYTFVVGTESGFGVLRDPIACKPAVMAETDDYVAFASEYRALAGLPGIETARVFEPEPAKVYFWDRAA
ncbi:glutamine amidotransferase family protein [Ancylobacter dichloromethanicus]|uniref:Glutamine amidotransferase n=1 Tax=Ancylobacter dichloromethanicus TaxID=518825 RepID=A0A9W6JE43_9HYPH|nr:glutamine amidotransferase family protein [Ancylobacter dichloromethanicus]MBS7552323.1 glutamine amidotransferase family protein [Ancylobacter dichloromethanicus]GLK74059.1 glutamine amidotransferase [Ancylobacter dichloromethanicus]